MQATRARRLATVVLAGAVTATAACSSGTDGQQASSASSSAASESASASPSPSPTPTRDDRALKPGTNHNWVADGYVYKSADVHDWLHGAKENSPSYPKTKKIAFLTFDDGPTNSTPKVLETLRRLNVPGNFFIIGGPKALGRDGSPEYLKQTIAEGHSVCIHTFSHNYSELYPGRRANAAAIVADHDRAQQAVRAIVGDSFTAHCQRYPGGHGWRGMAESDAALAAKGIYWLDWNAENGDGAKDDPGSGVGRANRVLTALNDNPNVAMILMHDYKDNPATIDSIEPIVTGLRSRGYEFAVLD